MARLLTLMIALLWTTAVLAQETNVGFGTLQADPTAPVEVTADSLNVNQSDGAAIFEGNVVVGQGEMRLTAARVRLIYDEATGDVARMEATGGVTLVSGAEAAEADRADYDVTSSVIVMTGDVLLTQGRNALTAERMDVDLTTNSARMTGRVKTILYQGNDAGQQN